jgi:hypothetical protein
MKRERRTRRRLVFGAAALSVAGLAGCVVAPYLPDVQLGARRLPIAPIRFERRAFDGGIEPFNC